MRGDLVDERRRFAAAVEVAQELEWRALILRISGMRTGACGIVLSCGLGAGITLGLMPGLRL